jgi:methanogenic corrinoid protein MtbC1
MYFFCSCAALCPREVTSDKAGKWKRGKNMTSKESKGELLEGIRRAVIAYDEEKCKELCRRTLEEGIDAGEAIFKGLTVGMDKVAELYASKEYFVPELLLCSDTLHAGLNILRPHLKTTKSSVRGKIILGVVEGDIHDIGKNLVKAMFEAAGWHVYDLGKDVKLERFVEEQQKIQANIVGVSALMTTSMLAIPRAVEALKARDSRVKIIVGGAPLNREIAQKFGADGYSPDAGSAVQEALALMGKSS